MGVFYILLNNTRAYYNVYMNSFQVN